MVKRNELDNIFVDMHVMSEERLEQLRKQYKIKKTTKSFNKFLIDLKEITHEQLRIALLRQKSTIGG